MEKRLSAAPVIGLPARMDPGTDSQYLSRQYADSVLAAGGVPVILPLLETPSTLRSLARDLDGILLTGSNSDIDPAHYGASREENCGLVQPLRDETDFVLLDVAMERKIPMLGVCFGMQSLNVFMGGSLIQDIPSTVATTIKHNNPTSEGHPTHDIEIVPGSILASLAGGVQARVNSTHHQALDRVGSGLQIIARAPDGVIESVVCTTTEQLVLGVQWHPERTFSHDALSRSIFDFFLARCRSRASSP